MDMVILQFSNINYQVNIKLLFFSFKGRLTNDNNCLYKLFKI